MGLEDLPVGNRPQPKDHKLLLRFRVLQRIGSSGMAEVFKALDEIDEVHVAFKRFLPEILRDEEVVSIISDEAEKARQLQHPAICAIRAVGRAGKSLFIASELVSGCDLQELIERMRAEAISMPIPVALHIAVEVCSAIDHAHQQGVLHQNLVPRNIRVSDNGLVKVTDFGTGRAAGFLLEGKTRILKQRYGYMSPEQVRGSSIDHRSDIFALGSVLYELVTGEPAFLAQNELATLDRVRRGEVEPPSVRRAEVPFGLEAAILCALAPLPQDRWDSASHLLDELERLRDELSAHLTSEDLGAWLAGACAPC
jgi:eukaryotic-like serine/threonine-protein kinase